MKTQCCQKKKLILPSLYLFSVFSKIQLLTLCIALYIYLSYYLFELLLAFFCFGQGNSPFYFKFLNVDGLFFNSQSLFQKCQLLNLSVHFLLFTLLAICQRFWYEVFSLKLAMNIYTIIYSFIWITHMCYKLSI